MKRALIAMLAVFGLACTPEQLNTLGISDETVRSILLAREDAPLRLQDGSVVEVDGSITPPPPPPAFQAHCPEFDYLLLVHAPSFGWDVNLMSRYMVRESNCQPHVRSRTRDTGLLQINDVNHPYLREALGEWVDRYTLQDPVQNVRAAAALCVYWVNAGRSCYKPWR